MIKFNSVTWYSRLASIIFFVGVLPTLTFYIGTQYQETKDAWKVSASIVVPKISSPKNNLDSVTTIFQVMNKRIDPDNPGVVHVRGKVVGWKYYDFGTMLLISDGQYYLEATTPHASAGEFKELFAKLKVGQMVLLEGAPEGKRGYSSYMTELYGANLEGEQIASISMYKISILDEKK